ncbi:MAG: hypothetical protein P4M07_28085 [Xanthobacteraceae bacterium]|nr:hypothetical protein [Xanthobacteraceae bacterium]
MSHTAAFARLPSQSLFGRFFNRVAGFLDRVALIAARNGDVAYPGL